MQDNWIDSQRFIVMEPAPPVPREEVEIVARPGVNGLGFWKTGQRGRPFSLRTAVDESSIAAAVNRLEQYRDLVGNGLVAVVYGATNYTSLGVKFVVLDVTPTAIRRLAVAQGGLNPPSLAWLEAQWTLVAVAV